MTPEHFIVPDTERGPRDTAVRLLARWEPDLPGTDSCILAGSLGLWAEGTRRRGGDVCIRFEGRKGISWVKRRRKSNLGRENIMGKCMKA